MENKYNIFVESDGYIEVYETMGGRTITNKEEWKEVMKTDYILDMIWEYWVYKGNKNE